MFACRERELQLWLKLVFSRALPGLFQQLSLFTWQLLDRYNLDVSMHDIDE